MTTIRLSIFIDDRLTDLIRALVDVEPCPVTAKRTADQIQQVFCKFGVWLESIRSDVIRDAIEDAARRYA